MLAMTFFCDNATGFTSKEYVIGKTEQKSYKFAIDAGERFEFDIDANATMDMTVYRVAANGSKTVVTAISNKVVEYETVEVDAWTCNVTLTVSPGYPGSAVKLTVRYTFMKTIGRWLSVLVSIVGAGFGIAAIVLLVKKGSAGKRKEGGAP
jgi:hypothetical protein